MRSGNSLSRNLGAVGLFAALAASVALAGCGGETDDRPPTWSYIYPAIIEPSCATASCHSRLAQRAGVDLGDGGEAWRQLVCRHFAIPNSAGQSELIYLLTATGANRMPPDFPLPSADITLIANWINQSAAGNDVADEKGTCQ